jgi:hypothetical protein
MEMVYALEFFYHTHNPASFLGFAVQVNNLSIVTAEGNSRMSLDLSFGRS